MSNGEQGLDMMNREDGFAIRNGEDGLDMLKLGRMSMLYMQWMKMREGLQVYINGVRRERRSCLREIKEEGRQKNSIALKQKECD